jgi:glycosyltransferase involved in cell wall biosynthesis
MAMLAAELAGITWSFTAHRWDIDDGNLVSTKVARASFARAISQAGLRSMRDQAREGDQSRIHIIHMGVNIPDSYLQWTVAGRSARDSTLLCAGNLNEGKGHEHLLDAVACLKAEKGLDRILVLIAGEGPLLRALRRKAQRLGISDHVRFLGHLPNDQLLSLYEAGAVDVFVLASSFEGIPVALMEAMSYGVPVIATNVGGVPELCGGDCGVLIPAEDPRALAEAIDSLVQDRSRMEHLGRMGRCRIIEEFSVESAARKLGSRMYAAFPGANT